MIYLLLATFLNRLQMDAVDTHIGGSVKPIHEIGMVLSRDVKVYTLPKKYCNIEQSV